MSDELITMKQVLDLLDAWIVQQTGVESMRFSYTTESNHLVTIELVRAAPSGRPDPHG